MIIDKIEPFEISREGEAIFKNELISLTELAFGLSYINTLVCQYEKEIAKITKGKTVFTMGCHPVFNAVKGLPAELVVCLFHWYSVSACNFVRLVGWLAFQETDSTKARRKFIDNYINNVIPNVLVFRNKIAAHYAFSTEDRKRRDNPAEKKITAFFPLGLRGYKVVANPIIFTTSSSGSKSTSETLLPWSISEVHAELKNRYEILNKFENYSVSLREAK